jgi:hypothetical protein
VKNTPLRRPPPRPYAHRARPKPGTPPPAPIYTTPPDVTCQRRWRRGDWFAGVGDNADRENALIRTDTDTGRPAQGRRRAESETPDPPRASYGAPNRCSPAPCSASHARPQA